MDGIRHGAAKIGVVLVFRSLRQESKGFVDIFPGRIARGEQLEDAIDRLAVGQIGRASRGRRVEILFEARAEQPVVVDVPKFAVEGSNLAPRVESGNIPAEKPLVHLGRTGPAGGGLGIARTPGVLLRGEKAPGSTTNSVASSGLMIWSGPWRKQCRFRGFRPENGSVAPFAYCLRPARAGPRPGWANRNRSARPK